MKIKLTALFLVIAVLLFWWLHQHRPIHSEPILLDTNNAQRSVTSAPLAFPSATNTNTDHFRTPEEFAKMGPEREKSRQASMEQVENEWRTPIEFYGIVEDESNNVVANAQVNFDCNDTSPTGTSFYHTQSDGNGFFSIKDISGLLLGVYVTKDGYYPYDPHGQNFYYAGQNQNFVPNVGRPIVFRLKKKGEGANLVHHNINFRVPKNGVPILIDLATGNLTASSENVLKVECWTDDKKEGWKFNWKCRVSVPGGGLQIYDEQFPFLAPQDGYSSDEVFDETVKPDAPWANDVKRNYYIKTGGGNYARMNFRMIAHGDHFCELDYYFNPSGLPNLEPAN